MKRKRIIFEQDTGIFKPCFIVSYGYTNKQIVEWVRKKFPKQKEYIESIRIALGDNEESHFYAHVSYSAKGNAPLVPRVLKFEYPPDNTADFLYTIVHEVTHIVDAFSIAIGCTEEREARAYLTEYLVENIRRKMLK